ncbi:hypothetical protein QJS10_CPA03g00644 [Acorus calamus]|uniref:SAM domain-containing protein n=1 Tax=Acorus calamus TaxID=4465 RepID=A0AAV9FB19_ACOCL|nr:hypothetical protein QJS10_CPA03g00644 [Acorus calamus]
MVKAKDTNFRTSASRKDSKSDDQPQNSLDLMIEQDSDEEDSWIIVKKQKITILIPPSSPEQSQKTQNKKASKQQKSEGTIACRSRVVDTVRRTYSRSKKKRAVSNQSEYKLQADVIENRTLDLPNNEKEGLSPLRCRTAAIVSDCFAEEPMVNPSPHRVNSTGNTMFCNGVLDNGATRPKQPKPLLATIGRVDLTSSINGCGSGIPLMNRWMRAPYLERELVKAGGMRRWLELQGLGQFVRIFEKENVGKYQLLNLTMGKLKDMGANAVGPRRKLIHAIDCICQPFKLHAF